MTDYINPPLEPTGGSLRSIPRLPVAGFWIRLGAFVFDLLAIGYVIRIVGTQFREQLLPLGRAANLLTCLLVFLYFTLANGPIGKGRTLGKLLTRIRTGDLDGGPLPLHRAAVRTLVLWPILLTGSLVPFLAPDEPSHHAGWLLGNITWALQLALLIAAILTVSFNPFKQGLHDFAAKSTVRPDGQTPVPFSELASEIGGSWPKFAIQPQLSGGVTVILVTLAIAILTYPSQKTIADAAGYISITKDLASMATKVGGTGINVVMLPEKGDLTDIEVLKAASKDILDEHSTQTLRLVAYISYLGPAPAWTEAERTRSYKPIAEYVHAKGIDPAVDKGLFHQFSVQPKGLLQRPLIVDVTPVEQLVLFYAFTKEKPGASFRYPPAEAPVAPPVARK